MRVPSWDSARTPHVPFICFGTYCSSFGKSARYAVEMCVRTSIALVHPRSLSSASLFVRLFCPQVFWQFCGNFLHFFLVNHPLPLTYFLSIESYYFIFDICLKWKSPEGTSIKFPFEGKPDDLNEVMCMTTIHSKWDRSHPYRNVHDENPFKKKW